MVKKLKLGMIGGGIDAFIGDVHRMASRLDGHWELVAGAFSSTKEKSFQSGKLLALDADRIYGTWEEMLKKEALQDDPIDAVSIVTPNYMHAKPAIAAMEAGFHVICDKPLTIDLSTAKQMQMVQEKTQKMFFLTHNYSANPMIRMAKKMIEEGKLGNIRIIQAEYTQGWLSTKLEDENKQASWRTDPKKSGSVGCLGDIGTHAFHLCEYVTNQQCKEVVAQLKTFVDGRKLDDHAQILMNFEHGATGTLMASQVAIGQENSLILRVFGDQGSIIWSQENPNYMEFSTLKNPKQILTRSGNDFPEDIDTRIPAGHPEGYLEAFAQIYKEAALAIEGRKSDLSLPSIEDGIRGLKFIEACLSSHKNNNQWTEL